MDEIINPRKILHRELSDRMAANSNYSLRAFARDLGISPQNISNVLNGKRGISDKMAKKLAEKLHLGPLQKKIFYESARSLFSRSKSMRLSAQQKLDALTESTFVTRICLELEHFRVVSNWHHFGLIELLNISKIRTPKFLSKRLGISENETLLALQRLENLKLLVKNKSGYKVNQGMVLFDSPTPDAAVKKFHRQIIVKALDALDVQSEKERYGSSSILPMRVKDITKAKTMIQEFREKLAAEVTDSVDGEELYAISIQFFKLSQSIPTNIYTKGPSQ